MSEELQEEVKSKKGNKHIFIPIYIGDWEQDVNTISLEAEGALLKLTLKLWKAKNKGELQLSFSFTSLALLFKCDEIKAKKLLKELTDNNILNHKFLPENVVELSSRRYIKQAETSAIKSINGSQGGRGKKKIKSKTKANKKQPLIYDICNIESIKDKSSDLQKRKTEFTLKVEKYFDTYPAKMIQDFISYWAEHSETGKKMRWEKETVFDIKRRLVTWESRSKESNTFVKNNTGQFPNHYDKKFEDDLYKNNEGKKLSDYWQHLTSLGLVAIKKNVQGQSITVDWVKKEQAEKINQPS